MVFSLDMFSVAVLDMLRFLLQLHLAAYMRSCCSCKCRTQWWPAVIAKFSRAHSIEHHFLDVSEAANLLSLLSGFPPPPWTPINAFLLNTRSSCFHSYTELHASVRRREERRKRPMDGGFVFHQKTSSQLVISCMALCYFHMLTFTTGKVCNTYEE